MSDKETNICYSEEDLGKNLYRKKTYYTLVIEQDVLANDEDEADRLFQDSGINHEKINTELTEENNGVETYYVDANYTDSGKTEYIGKVNYDPMDDDAEENGDVIIMSETDNFVKIKRGQIILPSRRTGGRCNEILL